MPIYRLKNHIPVINPSAYIHPTAVIIGDVIIEAHCYVGPNAVLRGDFGRLMINTGSNVQDTCVMHTFPDKDCIVDIDGHIGHGAILHGCHIGENALVGMNAVIMDDANIGDHSLVAANSFVAENFICPPRSLVMGCPAKIKRQLNDAEVQWKSKGTREYQQLAQYCLNELRLTEPLQQVEVDRPRINSSNYTTKHN